MAIFNDVDTFSELQNAIEQSNGNGEADTIHITGNITLTSFLPPIEEDVNLTIDGGGYTLDGDETYRHFFVQSGSVTFQDVTFANGLAQGGTGSGGGAGMGGSLFVYDGTVVVSDSIFVNNQAIGGEGLGGHLDGGTGSIDPTDPTSGSGGMVGTTGNTDEAGGTGGSGDFGGGGGSGGFGGENGSGGAGGAGGYGGGGGQRGERGTNGTNTTTSGEGGFGGGKANSSTGGGGAGMGGAIFVRSGSLTVTDTDFVNNTATGGVGANNGLGLGGAIFAVNSTTNTNGNNQGMPTVLPVVTLGDVTFFGNSAGDNSDTSETDNTLTAGTSLDNEDIFSGDISRSPDSIEITPYTEESTEEESTENSTTENSENNNATENSSTNTEVGGRLTPQSDNKTVELTSLGTDKPHLSCNP